MSTKLTDLMQQRIEVATKAEDFIATITRRGDRMTSAEQSISDNHLSTLARLNAEIKDIESKNTLATLTKKHGFEMLLDAGKRPTAEQSRLMTDGLPGARNFDPGMADRLRDDLSAFYRGQQITAADTPLLIGSGGLSGTVPTQILDSLGTYYPLDSFQLAGATIYNTDNTDPLVKPIVSAGAAPDAFSETQSATDSHPMQVDTFTFGGQKYVRLVKASEEALMNSALDLPNEITGELFAAVVNGFTATITAAMVTALQGNSGCLVDSGSLDPYGSAVSLIDAVPPKWANPQNCFMGSRAMRTVLRNARASGSGQPLLNPVDDTIFGHKYIINDNLTRLVYGNFQAGVFIRKSPAFFQILLEAYASSGERGFKLTQWLDQHFLAEKTAVTTQPLYFTHLGTGTGDGDSGS